MINRHRLEPVILGITLLTVVSGSLVAAPGLDALFGAFLAALMLAIAATDARSYIIPNELTGAALGLALLRAGTVGPEAGWHALVWAAGRALSSALPFLALMVGYRCLRGRDGLGVGDIKLAGVGGAWLSLDTVFVAIELAALSALGAYIVTVVIQKRPVKPIDFLPFGAFLAPAIWLGWLAEAFQG